MNKAVLLVQLGVNNSIVILSFNAQLPECFASDYALIRHLDQGREKKQLSIYLRRETLVIDTLKDFFNTELPSFQIFQEHV